MITKEVTYKKAFQNKTQRTKAKNSEYEQKLNVAYSIEPRLKEIDSSLSQIGSTLAITALSGDMEKLDLLKKQSLALGKEKEKLLKKSGVKPMEFECEICSDTGFVSGKICECIKKEAAYIAMNDLSAEMPLGNCRFENFDLKYYPEKNENGENPKRRITAIFKLCKEYALTFNPKTSKNLLFMGSSGLGKTHLTLAIVREVIEKGYLPIYGSAENLFSLIEAEKFSGEGKGTYEAMLNCDLLVIDDLGAEMVTSFTKSVLYNLVNTRILNRRPTVINTNLSMKEIEDKYTARIASRFLGEYETNRFLGVDIRQQKLLNK